MEVSFNSPMIQSRAKYSILIQEKRQSIKSNRLAKNVLVLACNKAQINLHKFQSRQLSLSVAFASNTMVSLHYSLLLNNTKSGYFTSNLPFSLHSVAGALEQLSLHDGSPLGDRSPSHCACVILRHCRLLSTAKPRAHASQRQIRFQSWRKATKASFLKT